MGLYRSLVAWFRMTITSWHFCASSNNNSFMSESLTASWYCLIIS